MSKKAMARAAINAALRVAGPQRAFRDPAHRRSVAVEAARAVVGKVSRELREQILAALAEADERACSRSSAANVASSWRRSVHGAARGRRRLPLDEPALQAPDLQARLVRAQRLVADLQHWHVRGVLTRALAEYPGQPLSQLLVRARRARGLRAFTTVLRTDLALREEARRDRAAAALAPSVLAAWRECGYRSPSERWCDRAGESITVRVGTQASVRSSSSRVWDSRKSLRAGTAAEHTLCVLESWNRDVANRTLAVVDNMLTLSAAPTSLAQNEQRSATRLGAQVYAAAWVEQAVGLTVRAVAGYLAAAQTGDGVVAVHGASVASALRTLESRIRPDAVEARLELRRDRARVRNAAQEAREAASRAFAAGLRSSPDGALLGALLPLCAAIASGALDIEVTVADSHAAGNCATGTRDWIARHAEGRKSAPVGLVLRLALRSGDRVGLALAACRFAVLRWSREQSRVTRRAA